MIRNEEGKPARIEGIFRDITDRKKHGSLTVKES